MQPSTSASPLVSIIVRSIDRPTLQQALESIAAQTYPLISVVVVNALGRGHRSLSERCGRFPLKMVGDRQGRPLARSAAANLGLDEASGEYLMFLDDDDQMYPSHVARLIAVIRDGESVPLVVYAGVAVTGAEGEVIDTYDYPYDRGRLLGKNFLPIHAVLFSRSLLSAGCRFDPDLDVYEDWDFWLQLSERCDFYHVPGVSATYRANLGNSGLSLNAQEALRHQGRAKIFQKWKVRWTGDDVASLVVHFEGERERILSDWRGAEFHLKEWRRRAQAAEGQFGQMQQQLDESQRQAAQAQQQLTEARQTIALGEQEASRMQGELAEMSRQVHALQTHLKEILASRSWRITRPMRAVGTMARKVKARVGFVRRVVSLLTSKRIGRAVALLLHGDYSLLWQRIRSLDRFANSLQEELSRESQCLIENFAWGDFVSRPLSQRVSILVPFYNGRPLMEALLATFLANTDAKHRIVLLDDASTDPELCTVLESFIRQRPDTMLLRNEANCGFVATANRGMRAVTTDVVILNSDVEVPPHWVERLMAPIFAGERVASATPFTNAGTICSFPNFCQDNPLLEAWSCDDIDAQFRRLRCEPILIPTGVGFCMAMSRDAIDRIGVFDEETFGRGYGEENDWCRRAAAAGFVNVAVPNLFVYHKHGGTFRSEEKQALSAANLRKLCTRYPDYQDLVQAFIYRDPLQGARNMALFLAMCHLAPERPMLVVDHGVGGGANVYRKSLVDRERAARPVIVLVDDYHRGQIVIAASFRQWHVEFRSGSVQAAAAVLGRLPIGEIFYNDAVSFIRPLELPGILREIMQRTGAALTVAFHDFLPVCPSYTLLDADGRYCGVPDPAVCDACLARNPADFLSQPPPKIDQWRAAWGEFLLAARHVICFSKSSAEIVVRAYPGLSGRIEIVPHTVPKLAASAQFVPDFSHGLHIGVVGGINIQKGARIVLALARILAATRPDIRLSVIGEFSCPGEKVPSDLHVTGRYLPEDLPALLSKLGVNVIFFPAIWPETFSYVTSEIIELGLPLCCFDLGAPAERVRDYRWGRVVPEIDANAALAAMLILAEECARTAIAAKSVHAA